MNNLKDLAVKSLAISLSGGGHRASLFTLGALMYLVDAEANERVTSIASVSGGSLTNGFVGQALDYKSTNGDDFRRLVARPFATQIAKSGTFFAPLLTKVYVALLIVGLILAVAIPIWTPVAWYLRILLFLVLLVVWGWLFGKRGSICARAFNATLFSPNGRATTLAQLKKNDLDHVICATELRSAEQVYFWRRLHLYLLVGAWRAGRSAACQRRAGVGLFPCRVSANQFTHETTSLHRCAIDFRWAT
jgi:hypothetical protein